ncbi:SHOCT domain-containing protein [Tepidibacillus marianensis]|uniref:SHOCT domain-containing protein n=1 Tax=Tepidibacillus marianensis TaxID=3131995 RepID=UPI0030D1CDA6
MFGGHMGGFFNPGYGGYGNGYGNGGAYGPGNFGNGNGYGIMSGFNFTGILFLLLIGFIVYLLVKRSKQNHVGQGQSLVSIGNGQASPSEAIEIAKLRYVRGEISFEEYQEIVKVIGS